MEGASQIASSAKRLEGRVAIITGGASGLGEGTARLFAEQGAKVIIADIQDDKGESLCKEIASNGGTASYMHCDVANETQMAEVVKFAVSKYGKLDIMYCNAGISGKIFTSVVDIESNIFKRVFDVNVHGCFLGAKEAARVMIPAKRGVILFTSSVNSIMANETPLEYTVSKHAVLGLMRSLCVELGPHGIRVNCIAPGPIATPLMTGTMKVADKSFIEKVIHESAVLKGVVPREDDVAEAALFLASDGAKYVSGVNLVVDGGFTTTNPSFYNVFHDLSSKN